MRSAIGLIWLSLFWTLLCFLFYRDRELIIQASLPVWVASAIAWIVYRMVTAAIPSGWWRRKARAGARKKAATRRSSAPKPRKRSS